MEKRKSQISIKRPSKLPLPRSSTSKTPDFKNMEKKVEQKIIKEEKKNKDELMKNDEKMNKEEKMEKDDKMKNEKMKDKEYDDFYQKVFVKLKKDEGKKRKILKLFREIAKHGEGDELFLKKMEEEIEIFLNLKQAAKQEIKERRSIIVQKENVPMVGRPTPLETLESEYFKLETAAKNEKETDRKENFKPVNMKFRQSIRQITQKEKIMNNTFHDSNNTNTNSNSNNNGNISSSKDLALSRDEKVRATKKLEDLASKSMQNLRSEKKIKIKQTIKEEKVHKQNEI